MNYTILYGTIDFSVDVTEIVYSKCIINNIITIKSGDNYRADFIFLFDPVPLVQKSIFIIDQNGVKTVYDAYTEVNINVTSDVTYKLN